MPWAAYLTAFIPPAAESASVITGTEIIQVITTASAATVFALVFWLLVNGRLHTSSETDRLAEENKRTAAEAARAVEATRTEMARTVELARSEMARSVEAARADLLRENERILAERDAAIAASRELVPILSSFVATSQSLIPLLQELVRNRER